MTMCEVECCGRLKCRATGLDASLSSLGNFRSEYLYDYEYEFSVLSTRTLQNVDLET